MLHQLSVKNYALISSLSVTFDDGFSVITGETGAGKSILLGALGFVLGDRSDASVLFDNDKKCVVEAVFHLDDELLKSYFEENDLDFSMECVLRRELTPQKKSRAFVNDTPVTLQQLKHIGSRLVDIHSQHDSLLLADSDFQLGLLDDAAGNAQLLNDYKNHYQQFMSCNRELKALKEKAIAGAAENDFLKFQLDELEKANLQENEYEEVSQRLEMLENSEEVRNILMSSVTTLEQSETSVLDNLKEIHGNMEKLKRFTPDASALSERVEVVRIELKDISRELDAMAEAMQFDETSLDELQRRYDTIQGLMMKHRVSEYAQLLKIRDDIRKKVSEFTNIDEAIEVKERELVSIRKNVERLSGELHERRCAEAEVFAKEVVEVVRQLAMPNAAFVIKCEAIQELAVSGGDNVRFMFSANKGIEPDDMARVASGGELSRLMLAIKSVAASSNYIPTLIFDEIDTGVSGEVASRLGTIMQEMGKRLQLVSITHLPQIASKAASHFFVYKAEQGGKTVSCIKKLSRQERIAEIAKMLSNDSVTDEALRAAEVLLRV